MEPCLYICVSILSKYLNFISTIEQTLHKYEWVFRQNQKATRNMYILMLITWLKWFSSRFFSIIFFRQNAQCLLKIQLSWTQQKALRFSWSETEQRPIGLPLEIDRSTFGRNYQSSFFNKAEKREFC